MSLKYQAESLSTLHRCYINHILNERILSISSTRPSHLVENILYYNIYTHTQYMYIQVYVFIWLSIYYYLRI